ncbi:MAG: hypothetical protein KAT15_23655 [Bacteroidales bacterium]|nr:hypothetical protein [Bacteroidales bacterium]
MQKERKTPKLEHKSLKQNPFTVPEGYFESFPGKVRERIREQEEQKIPVHRMVITRFRVAMAAAIVGVALISYSVIRSTLNGGNLNDYPDIALLEQLNIFDDDLYLFGFLDEEAEVISEEEAYMNQAVEYLALADVEMDLIFE